MPCDAPNGNCTAVDCGGCGCAAATPPSPILPRCQNVTLVPGTYTHATVVVNAAGCVASVTAGVPEVYAPDDCCVSMGGGAGGGGTVLLEGDPGPAATITVLPVVQGTGTSWRVENVGTTSAAVLQFTAPVAATSGGGAGGGYTGSIGGLVVNNGAVQSVPTSLVTSVDAVADGTWAANFLFEALPDVTTPGQWDVVLNLDGFATALQNWVAGEINTAVAQLETRLDSVEADLQALATTVSTLQTQANLTALRGAIGGNDNIVWNNSATTVNLELRIQSNNSLEATVPLSPGGTAVLPYSVIGTATRTMVLRMADGWIAHVYVQQPDSI